jgi:hypothetical protein
MMGTIVDAWDHVDIFFFTPTLKSPIIFSKGSALWNLKGFFSVNVSLPTTFCVFIYLISLFIQVFPLVFSTMTQNKLFLYLLLLWVLFPSVVQPPKELMVFILPIVARPLSSPWRWFVRFIAMPLALGHLT